MKDGKDMSEDNTHDEARGAVQAIRYELLAFTPDDDPDISTLGLAKLADKSREKRDALAAMLRECKGNYQLHLGVTKCLNCGKTDDGQNSNYEKFPHRPDCLTVRADALLESLLPPCDACLERFGTTREGFPEGWSIDKHGCAWGPYGVCVGLHYNGELSMKQRPRCGEPVPWVVVAYLREEYVKMLQEHELVQRNALAHAQQKEEV